MNGVASRRRGGLGGDCPERRESVHGGSGENILFSTVRAVPSPPTAPDDAAAFMNVVVVAVTRDCARALCGNGHASCAEAAR